MVIRGALGRRCATPAIKDEPTVADGVESTRPTDRVVVVAGVIHCYLRSARSPATLVERRDGALGLDRFDAAGAGVVVRGHARAMVVR